MLSHGSVCRLFQKGDVFRKFRKKLHQKLLDDFWVTASDSLSYRLPRAFTGSWRRNDRPVPAGPAKVATHVSRLTHQSETVETFGLRFKTVSGMQSNPSSRRHCLPATDQTCIDDAASLCRCNRPWPCVRTVYLCGHWSVATDRTGPRSVSLRHPKWRCCRMGGCDTTCAVPVLFFTDRLTA
ncbi:hypothetical protein CD178_02624 [Komagataeibacter saccharivorans]|uniref:Uncharacterized protein n=1 Tax=Komagataeibacter saccharivorans TaxID=265959 RepID=A0A347WES8_9PROT|nr:hypothetical protein CD178_02624 [Komagataeibacter saccharivorans]